MKTLVPLASMPVLESVGEGGCKAGKMTEVEAPKQLHSNGMTETGLSFVRPVLSDF